MHEEPVQPVPPPTSLPRILSLFDATMVVVGSIIGSGIFLKVGNVDKELQAYGFLPILGIWIGVGLVTLCGSLALAELGAMYPQAGGPYLYLREAYGRLPAFLWGWTEFWVVRTGSVGALACATAIYFTELVPLPIWGQGILAITMVIGLSVTNMFSTRWAASVQNIATIAKVTFLGGLILLPFLLMKIEPGNLQPLWSAGPAEGTTLSFWKAIGVAMIAVMWPYDGWINLGPVAEEIREPQRNVPRALALGLGVVIVVYVGAILSYHLTLTTSHLAQSTTVAADIFAKLFGSTGAKIAALGVMCSTFGATNSNIITGPRIYFAIARDGLVPGWVQQIHPTRQTPANSILLQGAWTILLISWFTWQTMFPTLEADSTSPVDGTKGGKTSLATNVDSVATNENTTPVPVAAPRTPPTLRGAFDGLTDSVICAGLIFYSMTVAAVYVLRFKKPHLSRPYRTWGYPVTPALLMLAYAGAFISQLAKQWQHTTGVLALIAAGVVYYQWALWKRRV